MDLPVSTACATAPAKGNDNKPAARSIEREIEVMAVSFPIAAIAHAVPSTKRASLYSVVDAAMRHTQKSHGASDEKGAASLRAIGMAVALADAVSSKDQPAVM